VHKADVTTFMCRLSLNMGASTSEPDQACIGIALLLPLPLLVDVLIRVALLRLPQNAPPPLSLPVVVVVAAAILLLLLLLGVVVVVVTVIIQLDYCSDCVTGRTTREWDSIPGGDRNVLFSTTFRSAVGLVRSA
jgi:hypothetical protein